MSIESISAAKAYIESQNRAANLGQSSVFDDQQSVSVSNPNGGFSSLIQDMVEKTVESTRKSESVSAQAVAGTANPIDVVTALNKAEKNLSTLIAVRDKVLSAYQEIMRMPI